MVSLLIAAALMQATAPVSSFTAPNAPPVKAGKVNKDGLVCRKETIVGSRLTTRICARPEDLERRKNEDRDMVDKAQMLQPRPK